MKFKRTLFIVLLCTGVYYSSAQITQAHYKVYSVALQKEIDLSVIISEMQNVDVLIFGEEHNDSVAHYLELTLLEMMYNQYGNKVALSLEMFDRDVQHVMDEYLNHNIREKHFMKDARAWSNYSDYKPMVEFSKVKKLDIICANAPTRYTNLAGREGQQALMKLPKETKKYFAPLPYDTASGAYYKKLLDFTSHSAGPLVDSAGAVIPQMPSMGGFNLIMSQSLWDATMAFSIAEYLKENKSQKVFQVNGRFHSDESFAIVTQLKKYSSKTTTRIISTGSDESYPNIDWSKYSHLGDYIIITDPKIEKTF